MIRVSAPGKLMIAGEYAVLEGAEAIVAAVDRRAYVTLAEHHERESIPGDHVRVTLSPEVIATRAAAEARVGSTSGTIVVDTGQLRAQDQHGHDTKLGLGSSAAAAAAVAGAIYAARGRDIAAPDTRREILEVALEGHRAVAPQGSGADVAASVLGGFVRFRRLGERDVETHGLTWPASVPLVVVWTGKAVRTSDMLAAVSQLAASDAARHRACMRELAQRSAELVSAVMSSDVPGTIQGLDMHAKAMGELGRAAGVGILDDTSAAICALARDHGGGAKPSGAGGGDVLIAGFPSAKQAEAFRAGCAGHNFAVLSLNLGVDGERREP